ncbi:MAG: cyclic nucleotide-binding domain-containing protein, partial [Treponema sp.]|nr:cyclic nucleotide-binding domain-containing protein [Treponema sp.]
YNEKGNQVTFQIANQINSVNAVPGIMKPFDVLEYKDKQIVCRQDEMSNDLFFIVEGKFGVYVNLKLNTVLTPSDMFIGEMAFLLNDRRTATVMAIGNCKLIKVPKTAFLSLIRKNPHYGIFLSKMLAQRLALQSQNAYVIQQKFEALQGAFQVAKSF